MLVTINLCLEREPGADHSRGSALSSARRPFVKSDGCRRVMFVFREQYDVALERPERHSA